jgi:hypothetical protein
MSPNLSGFIVVWWGVTSLDVHMKNTVLNMCDVCCCSLFFLVELGWCLGMGYFGDKNFIYV